MYLDSALDFLFILHCTLARSPEPGSKAQPLQETFALQKPEGLRSLEYRSKNLEQATWPLVKSIMNLLVTVILDIKEQKIN